MKYFAPIAPLVYPSLMKYGEGRTIMTLSQLVLQHTHYRDSIKQLKKQGFTVILDNGAAEDEQSTFGDLDRAADKITPDIVVIPDVLRDCEGTLHNMKSFLEHCTYKKSFMGVPQGNTFNEWMKCYHLMLEDDRIDMIGFSKIAIPHILGTDDIAFARNQIVMDLLQKGLLDKPIHLLGMGDPKEFLAYKGIDQIVGADSCYPVWAAKNEILFARDEFKRVPSTNEYFELKNLTRQDISNSISNIEYTNKCVRGIFPTVKARN